MTRKILLLFVLLISAVSLCRAQREQDFASRYMSLYAKGTSLECTLFTLDARTYDAAA